MRLINADELKKYQVGAYQGNGVELEPILIVPVSVIDNAPTVEPLYVSDLPDDTIKTLQTLAIDHSDGIAVFERKRPQGTWLKDGVGGFKCSLCDRGIATSISEKHPSKEFPYCHCGAKMQDM